MNIKKITNFIKENYKISIPIILLLVLFIAFIVYYFISGTFLFINNEEVNVFQYFTSEKLSYKAEVSKNRKGVITDIKSVDMDVYYDSTPIYYTDDDNIVVFPNKMSVVAPIMNCSEYVTDEYSYIKLNNKKYNLVTNGFNSALGHYFLYDGSDLYFFIEDVTLVVDGESIKLSPFSYVVVQNKKLSYYDRKEDKYISLDTKSYDNYVYNSYLKVYVNGDYVDIASEKVLLTVDLDALMKIKEMKRITE